MTLRLHKPGGVGLGPHGWVRVAGDRWRRIATGAGKPRPGGYRLTEDDLAAVSDLSRTVSVHPRRIARLRRALLRFEAGLDRRGAVDALNDHLLALRFLLEGEGPAGVGLPMRVAALAEGGDGRGDAKQVVEQAISLERELWSGEPMRGDGAPGPSEIAGRASRGCCARSCAAASPARSAATSAPPPTKRFAGRRPGDRRGLAGPSSAPTPSGSFDAIEVEDMAAPSRNRRRSTPSSTSASTATTRRSSPSRIQPDPEPEPMPDLDYGRTGGGRRALRAAAAAEPPAPSASRCTCR